MAELPMTFAVVLILGATIALWRYIVSSPLDKLSGPLACRVTQLRRFVGILKSHSDLTELELHRRHGSYVRMGPNFVSVSDPSMIGTIYSTRNPLAKSDFYRAADNVANGIRSSSAFSSRPEDEHNAIAKPIQGSFSIGRMLQLEDRIDSALDPLSEKLRSFAKSGKPCSLARELQYAAWDVAGELHYSKPFGALEGNPRAIHLMGQVASAMDYLAVVGQIPILDKFLKNPYYQFTVPGFGYLIEFTLGTLGDRVRSRTYTEQHDFVDLFIDAEDEVVTGEGPPFTGRQVSWLVSNIIAGSDSTASTLSSATYYVARNPEIKKRLVKELEAASITSPVHWKDCLSLPYLDAVAKETFRLEAGIGMPLERIVGEAGMRLPNDVFLPPGTIVGMNARVLAHDKNIYGPDADQFNPDRWLQSASESDEEFTARSNAMKAADLTFGRGSRSCVGKPIALLQVYKCLARLFAEFDVSLVEPEKDLQVTNRWFMTVHGMDVYLKERTPI